MNNTSYQTALRLMQKKIKRFASDNPEDKDLSDIIETPEEAEAEEIEKEEEEIEKEEEIDENIFNAPIEAQPAQEQKEEDEDDEYEEDEEDEDEDKDEVDLWRESAGAIIEQEKEPQALEKGISILPPERITDLTGTGQIAHKYGPFKSKAHRKLERILKKKIQESIAEDSAEVISIIDEDTFSIINEFNKEKGYTPSPEQEVKDLSEEEKEASIYRQNTQTSSEITAYIRLYGELVGVKSSADMFDPLVFFSLLKKIDEHEQIEKIRDKSSTLFAEWIYRMDEVKDDLKKKITVQDIKKIDVTKIHKDFVRWLLDQIERALNFIAPMINEHLKTNTDIKMENLDRIKIRDLVSSSGGFINELYKRAILKKEYFIKLVLERLEKDKKKSKDIREFSRSLSETTPIELITPIVLAVTKPQTTFPAESTEAKRIIFIYKGLTHREPGVSTDYGGAEQENRRGNIEPSKSSEYYEPIPYHEVTKDEESGTKTEVNLNPTENKEPQRKKNVGKELATEGKQFGTSIDPSLNYKAFAQVANRIVTIKTEIEDEDAKENLMEALTTLKARPEMLANPMNIWQRLISFIGRKRLAINSLKLELEEEMDNGKKFTVKQVNELKDSKINKILKQPVEKTDARLYDDDGEEIELPLEVKEKLLFPQRIVNAADEYITNNPAIFHLACSFKINKDDSVTKITNNEEQLRNLGVLAPELLPQFRYQSTLSLPIEITANSSLSQIYKYALSLFK
jgi:hypothetical protein